MLSQLCRLFSALAIVTTVFGCRGTDDVCVPDSSGGLYIATARAEPESTPRSASPRYGVVNNQGQWVVEPVYDDLMSFSEELAAAKKDGKWGFIDAQAVWRVAPQFEEMPHGFHDGLARVRIGDSTRFINAAGEFVLAESFDFATRFCLKRAFVVFPGDSHWSLITQSGEIIASNRYQSCSDSFSGSGLASVKIDGVWGAIRTNGLFAVDPQYGYALAFSEGLAAVRSAKDPMLWGFIDTTGVLRIPFSFEKAMSFSQGLAAVKIGDSWGYVDTAGMMAIDCQFDADPANTTVAYPFSDGLACVAKNGKYGYVNREGRMIIKPAYSTAAPFRHGLALVFLEQESSESYSSTMMYIDRSGRTVWRAETR